MPRISIGSPLAPGFMQSVTLLEVVNENTGIFLVENNGTEYLLQRSGKCAPQKCKAECCRKLCLTGPFNNYLEGFAVKGTSSPVVLIQCKYLRDDYLCSRWTASGFPKACRDFPVPGDKMYLEVMDCCGFVFKLTGNIPRKRRNGFGQT